MRISPIHPLTLARSLFPVFALVLLFAAGASVAADSNFDQALLDIQHRWAIANYSTEGKAQKKAFEALLEDARALAATHSDRAEALVWQGGDCFTLESDVR